MQNSFMKVELRKHIWEIFCVDWSKCALNLRWIVKLVYFLIIYYSGENISLCHENLVAGDMEIYQ